MIMTEPDAPRCDTGEDDVCCHEKEVGCNWWYIGGSVTQVRLRCFLLVMILVGLFIFFSGQYLIFYELTIVHRMDMTITTQTTSTTTTSTTTTTTTTTTPKPYYEQYYLFLNYCRFKHKRRRSLRVLPKPAEPKGLITNRTVDEQYLRTNPENILTWLQGAGQHSEIKLPKQKVQKKLHKSKIHKVRSKVAGAVDQVAKEDEKQAEMLTYDEIVPRCDLYVVAGAALLVVGPILTVVSAYFFTNRNLDHMLVPSPDCMCDFTPEPPPKEPERVPQICGQKSSGDSSGGIKSRLSDS